MSKKKILAHDFFHTHPNMEERIAAIVPSFTEHNTHVIVDKDDYLKVLSYLHRKGIHAPEIEAAYGTASLEEKHTGKGTTTFEVDIYKESGKWYTRRKLTTPHFEGHISDNDAIIAFIEANIPEVKGCDYSYEVWQGHAMNKHLVKR